jgi:hypothetical protein
MADYMSWTISTKKRRHVVHKQIKFQMKYHIIGRYRLKEDRPNNKMSKNIDYNP